MLIHTTAITPVEQLRAAIIREPLMVSPDTTVIEAIAQMSSIRSHCNTTRTADSQRDNLHLEARSSCVLVVENEQIIGVLTERDVVRLSAQQQPLDRLAMWEVMTHPLITLRESALTDLFFTINLLQQHHIRHLPILDQHDRLVGLVTHESLRQTSRPIDLLRLRLVSEVMAREVICAAPDISLLAIAQLMAEHRVSSVMIVHPGGISTPTQQIPVGIITERDIVQFQALGLNLQTCLAEAVMSTPIFQIKPEESLWTVQQIMEQRSIRRLAVTGELGELLGIITQTSLLQALNPLELYKLAEDLEQKVVRLEAEKVALLENRTIELEQQVAERTLILKTKAHQEKLLNTIAEQIRSSLNLSDILDTTVQEIRSLLECDRVIIYQLRPDFSGTVIAEAITGTGRSVLHTEVHDPCISPEQIEPYLSSKIRIVNDIYSEAMTPCHQELLVEFDIRAKLMVPIVIEEQLWGLMLASYREKPHPWTTDEIELLRQISLQIAIALQQAITHQKLQNELTKRQRIEATLIESEQRYATLATAAPVGIFRTDAQGLCTYVNDRYTQISGLTPEATIGQGWQQGMHPDDHDWVIAQWQQFIQSNHSFQLEYRFQRPDGTVTWVYGQCVADLNPEGQIIGYVGTITDISDRKRTEDRLRESEERYATLVEAATVGIFRTDAQGNCTYINDRYSQISGLTPEAIIGQGWQQGMHPDDPDWVIAQWQQYIQDQRPFGLEYRFQRPDGTVAWVYGQSVAELNAEGQIVGYVGTVTDISDRIIAEQKLQQLNQELEAKIAERTQELSQVNSLQRAILDGADYSIISTNPTGIIQTFNAAAEKMLGYNAAEIINQVTPVLIHDAKEIIEQAAILSAELKQEIPPGFEVFVAKTRLGLINETEWTYIRKDGTQFPVSLSITALKDINQQIIGFLGIAKDISDRKRAEAELQKLSDRLALSLKSGAIGCWEWDLQNLIVWDERMYELYGVTKQSDSPLVYDIWANRLHPEDRTYTETLLQQAVDGEAEYDTEFRVIHPDGSIHFIKAYGVVVRDAEGNPQSMIGVNFDISDRKQAELERQQLIQELSAFKQALDQSAVVVITNPKGVITYVNDRFCIISGYSRNQLIGQTHRLVKSDYHPPSFFQNLWRTISGGQVWRGEICNRSKNGSLYWVSSTIVPFLDEQGIPFQYLAIRFDITDRKLAEATLQQENTFRQQIVENMAEGLCVFHPIKEFPFLDFTVWNQQMQAITGYTLEQINRLGWYQSLYPEPQAQKQAIAQLEKIGQENQSAHKKEIQRQDGQKRTISISTSILSSDDGLIYILALIQDITHRQQTERENRQLKERLEFLLYSSPAMIYSCKPYGDYGATFMSKNIEAILGYKAEDFLSIPGFWANHIHPEDAPRVFADLSALFEQDTHQHEYRFLHHDGHYIWMRDELRLVRDEQGTPIEIVGYFADITDIKRAESALKQQLAAIEAAIDGIAIIKEDNYLYVNQAHLKLFGYDRPIELLGKSWKLLYTTQELERFEQEVFPVLGRDRAWQGEAIATRKDGSTFAEGLSLTLTEDGLLICVCRDISDRKQYEAQLKQTNQELTRATRLKDEFLANMSHELRTPLNAILGMTEGLQEGVFGIVNEPQIKALQTIDRSGSHLLELINDILDVAKIESGQMELDCTLVSVNHLCQSSLAFIKQQAMQKRIQLTIEQPPNLPDLFIDERRIRQVLINLLNNAVKFTPAGGQITLKISRQLLLTDSYSADSLPQNYLRIAVIDTGIGIAPEDINKLFQPFIQIDSALNRQYTGTGLGLALVKRIIQLHGGQVLLTSEIGVGSCFAIDLKCAADAPSSPQFPIPDSQFPIPDWFDSAHKPPEASPLILLAEDNEANISTVSSYLRAKGYRIIVAKNGREAIALAQSENPNLILMDIQMPGMDGMEAMRQIRLYPSLVDVPMVALTALAMTGDRDRCLEAGANDYMTKPVKLKQLAAIIQQFLTLKKANS